MPCTEKSLFSKSLIFFYYVVKYFKILSKNNSYISSQRVQVKNSILKEVLKKCTIKSFRARHVCSWTFFLPVIGARWHYWHCTEEKELATAGNHSAADKRNWKSGSTVLHAFYTAWLMGHVADILLVKLEKCLSLHCILKSLNCNHS